jgi:aminopeptidase YwaD
VGDFIGVLSIQKYSDFAGRWAKGMADAAPGLKVVVADKFPFAPPDFRRSDHAPFWAAGVPALMLTDTSNFRNPNYHKPTDTIETIDPERLTLAARGVVGAIRAVADAPAEGAGDPKPGSR